MLASESASGRKKDDPIIFFTLIDFLVQLIFFGLLIVVVFVVREDPLDRSDRVWAKQPKYLPVIDSASPYIHADKAKELEELLRRLSPDQISNIAKILKARPFAEYCAANSAACEALANRCTERPDLCLAVASALSGRIPRIIQAATGNVRHCAGGRSGWLFKVSATGAPGAAKFTISSINPAQKKYVQSLGKNITDGLEIPERQLDEFFSVFSFGVRECHNYIKLDLIGDSHSTYRKLANYFLIDEGKSP